MGFTFETQRVNLWLDSSDFPLARKRGKRGRSSSKWSYKLNRPGRRYMFLRDGRRMIRHVWGGYSPKLHDGMWLEAKREELEEKLRDGEVAADQHFSKGKKIFKSVRFHTPFKLHLQRYQSRGEIPFQTRQRVVFNKDLGALRARVERPFGSMKQRFAALAKPWLGPVVQLDYLVKFAAAVYNLT